MSEGKDTLEIEDVKRLHLNPGDVLVVKVPRGTSYSLAYDSLHEIFPGNKVLIVHPDIEITVLDQGEVES